ncbi:MULTISPECIES: VOC family protein [Streptomyces]|uniref:VOC family protein n=1 Tax=Streptomyces TaxID=1883 RepID=UPI00163BC23E|nr:MULTISPECIES: VOC family protein [Streptomyces]MBC2878566.1 glyoxalase/bleomycin resistance/extradiol dioxygenase family protein [Streptomyces sp. TYQ1024]UBI35224.1 glyoxalase/bleomycin resistance/extradiol dioxygenase family protein [Streptomyces mobaraensis]UKW27815.1 glyoxalase/bleomycin resistance/extradiol dioxygenase family protein [Streptomyces sp. TYQ1024]
MDALHPRLLVGRFAETFRFYAAVLPELTGARLVQGTEEGPYAHWDLAGEGVLMLLDRRAMADVTGPAAEAGPADRTMLVSRVPDVDAGYALCLRHGATAVAAPAQRPEWGPTLRTAHVRDPEGNLVELQSYDG